MQVERAARCQKNGRKENEPQKVVLHCSLNVQRHFFQCAQHYSVRQQCAYRISCSLQHLTVRARVHDD